MRKQRPATGDQRPVTARVNLMPTHRDKAYERGFSEGFKWGNANGLRLAGVVLGKTHQIADGKLKKVSRKNAPASPPLCANPICHHEERLHFNGHDCTMCRCSRWRRPKRTLAERRAIDARARAFRRRRS